uniref:SAP domain-containing protein n=1 Tax=Salvator merianae TaxID=96440 RepID=A0A8D0DR16_SALMN
MAAAEGAGGSAGSEGASLVVAPPAPSSRSASSSPALGGAAPVRRRPLSELRVIDLRAELKRRNLDTGGNKSVLLERLRCCKNCPRLSFQDFVEPLSPN